MGPRTVQPILTEVLVSPGGACATVSPGHGPLSMVRAGTGAVRGRARVIAVAGLLVAALAVPLVAQTLRVRPLVKDGEVLVSVALEQGYNDEVRSLIRSGLRTTFAYAVDLKLRVPGWIDRTLASRVVTTSVEYDNLTRRHTLSRMIDGRVEESRVVEDEEIVREFVTSLDRLPLFRTSLLEPNREYYIVVRAASRPQSRSTLWPWGGATSASARFTFIP